MSGPLANGNIDQAAKQIKRDLDNWRDVVLSVNSVLVWKRPTDPGIIVGGVSIIFLLFWYIDPSIITTIALIGLVVTLVDFLVPTLTAQFIGSESWNASKEKEFEKICKLLAEDALVGRHIFNGLACMRKQRPKLYYILVVSHLLSFAYIGNWVNNLFLTYIAVLVLLLAPGLQERGYLQPVVDKLKKILISVFCTKDSAKKSE